MAKAKSAGSAKKPVTAAQAGRKGGKKSPGSGKGGKKGVNPFAKSK